MSNFTEVSKFAAVGLGALALFYYLTNKKDPNSPIQENSPPPSPPSFMQIEPLTEPLRVIKPVKEEPEIILKEEVEIKRSQSILDFVVSEDYKCQKNSITTN